MQKFTYDQGEFVKLEVAREGVTRAILYRPRADGRNDITNIIEFAVADTAYAFRRFRVLKSKIVPNHVPVELLA